MLAGGRSTRFGADKLATDLDGTPLLHHAVRRVAQVCGEVVVVCAPDAAAPTFPADASVRLARDVREGEGPLAGLFAGLAAVDTPLALVAAGDMPDMAPAVLVEMLRVAEEALVDAVALRDGERARPLPCVVRVGTATTNADALLRAGERSLRALLDPMRVAVIEEETWRALDPSGGTLRDIDTPGDLAGRSGPRISHVDPVRVGRFEIGVICEGFSPLPLHEECPGQDVAWDTERARAPWAFHGSDAWAWHVHAFVIRGPSGITLVDSGVGAFGPWRPWASSHPDAWAGVDPVDVSHVVLTHLHADHAGGIAAGGAPRFPNAAVHLHPGDHAWFANADDEDYVANAPLRIVEAAGMLDLDPTDRELVPGISVRHAPGHTPGHRSVVVADRDAVLLITGDLLHLPIQAAHPEWASGHDDDPRIGAVSRRLLLWRAANAGWEVAVNHFAVPFGRVGPDGWVSTG